MKTLRTSLVSIVLAAGLAALAQDASDVSLGTPAQSSQAQRTITIGADTKHVNVRRDEIIKFVAGEVVFAWKFDGQLAKPFNLQQLAPSGALANPVTVYVTRISGRDRAHQWRQTNPVTVYVTRSSGEQA